MAISTITGLTSTQFLTDIALAAASYADQSAPVGWRTLAGQDLGLSSGLFSGGFYQSGGLLGGAAARVMVNGDTLALSFRGTDGGVDVADYPRLMVDPTTWLVGQSAYIWTYDGLLDAVADYVVNAANGIANVIVTGHSLGAAAVNQLRDVATDTSAYRNVFDTATFFAVASPVIDNDSGAIFNFGHDNDIVYRAINLYGDNNATGTDNIVYFDSSYASGLKIGTAAHGLRPDGATPGAYADTAKRLVDYGLYADSAITPDSQIIIDAYRGAVTVADKSKAAMLVGEAGVADTLKGGDKADILIGAGGADQLTGGAGNDIFRFLTGATYRGGTATVTDLTAGDALRFVGVTLDSVTNGNGANLLAGDIALATSGGVTTLRLGIDTVAGADLSVNLTGSFSAGQFAMSGDTLTLQGTSAVASNSGSWWNWLFG